MTSKSPSPKLAKSTALSKAQATVTRLATLVPTLTTALSPVTVYQPGGTVGGELTTSTGGLGVPGTTPVGAFYGVWVAPDFTGTGAEYTIQVECFGGGGGGGGGAAASGGGGGGGGEYACETQYPVIPGNSYAYVVGLPGSNGINNSSGNVNGVGAAGTSGGTTIFDIAGLGLASGVVANGGLGGDLTSIGIGGAGGSGSPNSIHFPGGAGGTNNSSNGADDPLSFSADAPEFFTIGTGTIEAWYVLNDKFGNGTFNDGSGSGRYATVINYNGGIGFANTPAPPQVPAYATSGGGLPLNDNATVAGLAARFKLGSLTSASAKIACPAFPFQGGDLTLSCWIQPDASGTWGNTAAGSYAVIAANTQGYNSTAMKGYALYLVNEGTASAPNWNLMAAIGNGSSRAVAAYPIGQTPGTWHYVVMTYASGTLKLYVNGVLESTVTTPGFTSAPGGGYVTTLGLDPNATANWFFGSMSNVWFAYDCANTALVNQAYGLTPATGGCGGGASGGPGGTGGSGAAGAGATGGGGGGQPAQPVTLASTTTPAMGGFAGANAGSTNVTPPNPPGGVYGAGGGGSGDMASNPALTVITVPFASAMTYCGQDAASGAGGQFNTAQQSNPNSSLNTVLYAGGAPNDTATGSKISVLLLPEGLAKTLKGGAWTISQVFLTITNAYPTNSRESILEVYATNDTSLPSMYTAAYSGNNVASIPIPAGAGTITYDITESGIGGAQVGLLGLEEADDSAAVPLEGTVVGRKEAGGGRVGLTPGLVYMGGFQSYGANAAATAWAEAQGLPSADGGFQSVYQYANGWSSIQSLQVSIADAMGGYPGPCCINVAFTQSDSETDLSSTLSGSSLTSGCQAAHAATAVACLANDVQFIRTAWEFNGGYNYNWMPPPANYTAANFKLAWQLIYNVYSAAAVTAGKPANWFQFVYCMVQNDSNGNADMANYYPGMPYASYITIDEYDRSGGGYTGWNEALYDQPTITEMVTFALAQGATGVGFPEWGIRNDAYGPTVIPDPSYITSAMSWAQATAAQGLNVLMWPWGEGYNGGDPGTITNGENSWNFAAFGLGAGTMWGNLTSAVATGISEGWIATSNFAGGGASANIAGAAAAIGVRGGAGFPSGSGGGGGGGSGGLQLGTCTAFLIGPNNTPTIDAYNAPTGADFYSAIYGPGAADAFGNSQAPYLTIVLAETTVPQVGSDGAGGGILLTAVNSSAAPVALTQPYAGTDEGGNPYGAGYTAYPANGGGYWLQNGTQYSQGGLSGGAAVGSAQVGSGTVTSGDSAATLTLASATAAGTGATASIALPSGFVGSPALTQTAGATLTNANNGTQPITIAWPIHARDAKVGTTYEVWVPFSGNSGSSATSALGFKPYLNGSVVTTSNGDTAGATLLALYGTGATWTGKIHLTLEISAAGSGGTANIYIEGCIVGAFNIQGSTSQSSTPLSSQATGVAFNTTIANTIAIAAVWTTGESGQTVGSIISSMTRKGP